MHICLLGGVLGEKAPYQILGLNLLIMHAKSFEYISFSNFGLKLDFDFWLVG